MQAAAATFAEATATFLGPDGRRRLPGAPTPSPKATTGPAAPEEPPAGASAVDGLNRALAALALALYVAALFTTLQDPLEGALRAPPTSAVLAPVERQGAPKVDPFFVGALVGVALEEVVAARKLSDDAP